MAFIKDDSGRLYHTQSMIMWKIVDNTGKIYYRSTDDSIYSTRPSYVLNFQDMEIGKEYPAWGSHFKLLFYTKELYTVPSRCYFTFHK